MPTLDELRAALGQIDRDILALAAKRQTIALEIGQAKRALGIPTALFTAIFALARTVGWIAQLNEMLADPDQKIGRPRQLFTGATARDVVPLHQR